MQAPPLPADEAFRLEALRSLCVLDTPDEARFDRVTRSVARLFRVPMALVSLVDESRQWFKSRQGLEPRETPRDISFCGWAILGEGPFVVEDAREDPRFADNPLVTGPPFIRFYAGAPLHGPGRAKIGTLCILDHAPRAFPAGEVTALEEIAAWAEGEINAVLLEGARAEQEDLRRRLAAAEARFRVLADLSPDIVSRLDAGGRFTFASAALARVLGLEPDRVLGHPAEDLADPGDRPALRGFLEGLAQGGVLGPVKVRVPHAQGGAVWLELRGVKVEGPGGGEVLLSARDITDLQALETYLAQETTRDALTGLHNKRYFMERLEPALRSARRYGHPLSLCLCDLDGVKAIARDHGASHGDEVLKSFAAIARAEIRSEDLAARFGSDEFAFLFPFIPPADAAACLERIRARLREKTYLGKDDQPFGVTATFGVAGLGSAHATAEDLFEAADAALFHAKSLGPDRVHVEG
ncbi:MAG: sensor domain-containing diguanylate cyclase [Holophagaceae bacterium]